MKKKKKRRITIRTKLLLYIVPIMVITITVLVLISSELSKARLQEKSIAQLSASITNQADNIESWMNDNMQFFSTVKKTIEITQPDEEGLQKILDMYYGYNKYASNGLYVGTEYGKVIKAADSPMLTTDATSQTWYQQGISRINMDYGTAYQNGDGNYVISASGILQDGTGEVKVIAADVNLDQISIIVNSGVKMNGALAFLVDTSDGTILAAPDNALVSTNISFATGSLMEGIAERFAARDYSDDTIADHMVAFKSISGTEWELVSYAPSSLIMLDVMQLERILTFIGVGAVLVLIFLISITVSRIFKPLSSITKSITEMSSGDFTIKIKAQSNDELGIMGSRISEFVESMRGMLSSINSESVKLRSESENSNQVSQNMFAASQAQSEAMQGLNNTVDMLAVAVNEIAQNATTLAQVASDARENSNKADNSMKETVEITRRGREEMQYLGDAMDKIQEANTVLVDSINKVGTASEEITKIVGMIAEIAEETNLLSLNASIEAARAGEAGRGFAVVASEIGNLANNSAKSADHIANLIHQVRSLIADVVNQADASAKSIQENSERIDTAVDTFNQIYTNIHDSNEQLSVVVQNIQTVEDVATNVAAISEEQAASTDEILETSRSMVEHADHITRSSQDVANNSHELADTSQTLAAYVAKFKI